jgi:hypothetical protein
MTNLRFVFLKEKRCGTRSLAAWAITIAAILE